MASKKRPISRGRTGFPRAIGAHAPDRFDRPKDRLGLHNHATATAVRVVVGDQVLALGIVPDVMQPYRDDAGFLCAPDDAIVERSGKHTRKEGEYIKMNVSHGREFAQPSTHWL